MWKRVDFCQKYKSTISYDIKQKLSSDTLAFTLKILKSKC